MTIYQCMDCAAPLPSGTSALCDRCAGEAALERLEAHVYLLSQGYDPDAMVTRMRERLKPLLEKRRAELGIWEGVAPEPDLPTDGDTQPNATEYDCDYNTATGACFRATIDYCEDCPYRQAIGDVAS